MDCRYGILLNHWDMAPVPPGLEGDSIPVINRKIPCAVHPVRNQHLRSLREGIRKARCSTQPLGNFCGSSTPGMQTIPLRKKGRTFVYRRCHL